MESDNGGNEMITYIAGLNEITAAQPNKIKKKVAKVSCRAAVKRPDTKKA